MSRYVELEINLSPTQRTSIANAVSNQTSVRLKLSHTQLTGHHNAKIQVTPMQHRRIQKSINAGKGLVITLSKTQLKHHQKGGFLPVLLGALVSSLAPVLFSRLFPDKSQQQQQEGHGIVNAQKYQHDDNMVGAGAWDPLTMLVARNAAIDANNQRVLSGRKPVAVPELQGNYLPDKKGSGLILPGTNRNYRNQQGEGLAYEPYGGNDKELISGNGDSSHYHLSGNHTSFLPDSYMNVYGQNEKKLNQKNVKRGQGLGYVNPNSEKFQMLKNKNT